ncbi:Forkhead box protein J2, partial [Irineochytrium annulatum]
MLCIDTQKAAAVFAGDHGLPTPPVDDGFRPKASPAMPSSKLSHPPFISYPPTTTTAPVSPPNAPFDFLAASSPYPVPSTPSTPRQPAILCTGSPVTCMASYCLCRSTAYSRQQFPYHQQQTQAFINSFHHQLAMCASPSPVPLMGAATTSASASAAKSPTASTKKHPKKAQVLKTAEELIDEILLTTPTDSPATSPVVTAIKGKGAGKRVRRNGEAGGDSKDPKYVLTTEIIDFKGQQYCRVYRRPPISYADLITYAIAQSALKKLKLQSIYTFLISTFGYFKHHTAKRGWENSIRHNLSMKSRGRFLKVKDSDDSEKGSYWHLNKDPSLLNETIENARETAARLESWQGILYLPIRTSTPHPLEPMLFSEEDKNFTEDLCVLDESNGTS